MSIKQALESIIESMWEDWNKGADDDVWIGHAKSLQVIVDMLGENDIEYKARGSINENSN